MTAQVFAFANQKGGVAKTTTAVNLGDCLAAAGRRVLLVDTDPQGNATTSLGIDPRGLSVSIYDALIGRVDAADALAVTGRMGLDLLPANADLAGAEVELTQVMARERRLEAALRPMLADYDYIFIDEPPSLGLLSINGLAAAHGAIIPVQCEYLALEGLSLLLNTIGQVRSVLNPGLVVAGVILTMYDRRTRLSQEVVHDVRTYFPNEVFDTIIPRNVRLSEAPSHGRTIASYAPESAGARAYQALAQEFVTRMEPPEEGTHPPVSTDE